MAVERTGEAFADWIRKLAIAWKTLAAYPQGHPALERAFERAYQVLDRLLGPVGELRIGISRHSLLFEGTEHDFPAAHRFAEALYRRNVAVVTFREGLDPTELGTFLRLLAPHPRAHERPPLAEELAAHGVTHLELTPVDYSGVIATEGAGAEAAEARNLWDALLKELMAGRSPGEAGDGEVLDPADEARPGEDLIALIARLLHEHGFGQGLLTGDPAGEGWAEAGEVGLGSSAGTGSGGTGSAGTGSAGTGSGGSGSGGTGSGGTGGGGTGSAGTGSPPAPAAAGPALSPTGPGPAPVADRPAAGPPVKPHSRGPAAFSRAVADRLGRIPGLRPERLSRQVTHLLRPLPRDLRGLILDSALRLLAADEQAGAAMEAIGDALARGEILASLRRLQGDGVRLSSHATRLLQTLTEEGREAADEDAGPGGPGLPGSGEAADALLAELRRIFREEDIDRLELDAEAQRYRSSVLELPPRAPATGGAGVAGADGDDGAAAELYDRLEAELAEPELTLPAAETLLALLTAESTQEELVPGLASRLQSSLAAIFLSGNLQRAVSLLEEIQGLIEEADTPEPQREALIACLSGLSGEEVLDGLIRALPGLGKPALARRLVEILGRTAIRHLLTALSEEEDRSQRRHLLDLLASLGPEVAPEARPLLADERWFVVRNMILLLRTLGDRDALPELRRCADHPDLRVRLEAIKSLFALPGELPRELLERAINDPDPMLAESAVALSGSYGIREAVDPLVRILTRWDPFGSRRSLRLKALQALGELGDPTALPRLRHLFRPWSWPPAARQERRLAYRTLGRYPWASRRAFVELGARSWDRQVRATCKQLARRQKPHGTEADVPARRDSDA